MNKERIFAIVLGLVLALVVSFYFVFREVKETENISELETLSASPTQVVKKPTEQPVVAANASEITLEGVEGDVIVSKSENYPLKINLPVEGLLVVMTNTQQFSEYRDKGEYQVDLKLYPVENKVKIILYTFNSAFSVLEKDLKIYYSPD